MSSMRCQAVKPEGMSEAEWKWRQENPGMSPIVHMSRVVGYFSRIDNWNKSKKGELKDRQKGNYSLPES